MSDQYTRPYDKNYSGLTNQSVIAICISILAVAVQETFKRRRRGELRGDGLGSRESWEFGYLYQGRSWAKNPSPPSPTGWPLSWVKEAVYFPEDKLRELRGIDAALYTRFLRGCFWFCLLQTFIIFPILLPIHVQFSDDNVSSKSMTRALISSLVTTSRGRSLLWLHICFLFWLTLSWMATLVWICYGAFGLRTQQIEAAATCMEACNGQEKDPQRHAHPQPQYNFIDVASPCRDHLSKGLRMRSVLVSNIPQQLRSEKELKEYFEYFMSRPLDKPSVGLPSSTQPGFFNKSFAFMFNKAKRIPTHLLTARPVVVPTAGDVVSEPADINLEDVPVIERVVVARKMTELASLLGRREEVLRRLESAHIRLARKVVLAVKREMDRTQVYKNAHPRKSTTRSVGFSLDPASDLEHGELHKGDVSQDEGRMMTLVQALASFVEEFGLHRPTTMRIRNVFKFSYAFRKLRMQASEDENDTDAGMAAAIPQAYPPRETQNRQRKTIWETLFRLDRAILDPYQPLINLSHFFRGQIVPAIDYYTAKLALLTSLITENRAKAVSDFEPVSTAFVTFADPRDARRACKYLAVHPNNPLACLVTMAPGYDDIDWIGVMKCNFGVEFLKDWVVNFGVWAFTVFWLFPVSLLVGLVSIQNISTFLPKLKAYLDLHPWQEELIQSFLPTLLVALLALLIPVILFFIAKKAHTITTLSTLHDLIMTRYYKFLIVNVLVFFCVGTAALQSFLTSIRSTSKLLNVVALSFPTAGPFYVGWLIFTVAMHGGFELALFGLPLVMHPSTSRQITPRNRAVGIRPRTFNYYYWLPTHLLVLHVFLVFSVLNPLLIPFGTFYFFIESGIVKNQLIHVYAKNYEENGQVILIRIVRYSLDGLMLAQAVFLAYMAVLQKDINVALAAFMIVFTAIVKIWMTRVCRAQFESHDILEAQIICGRGSSGNTDSESHSAQGSQSNRDLTSSALIALSHSDSPISTWRLPDWANFSYSTVRQRIRHPIRRQPNPFGHDRPAFTRLDSVSWDIQGMSNQTPNDASVTHQKGLHRDDESNSRSADIQQLEPMMEEQPRRRPNASELRGPVVRHPPPIPWDDQPNADLPYDNPYYTRAINNHLWLPRNPFGILDLDDTVDFLTSLTSEPKSGQLGTWFDNAEVASHKPASTAVTSSYENPPSESILRRQYSGSEEIDLPMAIAKRVHSMEKEDDVEDSGLRHPSLFTRRISSMGTEMRSIRRPSVFDGTKTPCFRSFSADSVNRTLPSRIHQAQEPTRISRSVSADHHLRKYNIHSPSNFVLPIHSPNVHESQLAFPGSTTLPAQIIPTHEALAQEVISEEEAIRAERLKEEQEEGNKETAFKKSWLTSWLFTKA